MLSLVRSLLFVSATALATQAAGVWQSQPRVIQDFWVGPFSPFGTSTVLAIKTDVDGANILYCLLNGSDPSKSILAAVQTALVNGNPAYPSMKPCGRLADGFTWCEIDGIHLGK
jgi:hypothetical protein